MTVARGESCANIRPSEVFYGPPGWALVISPDGRSSKWLSGSRLGPDSISLAPKTFRELCAVEVLRSDFTCYCFPGNSRSRPDRSERCPRDAARGRQAGRSSQAGDVGFHHRSERPRAADESRCGPSVSPGDDYRSYESAGHWSG